MSLFSAFKSISAVANIHLFYKYDKCFFYTQLIFLGPKTCAIHPTNQVACGWYNINRGNCEAKGCCFDDSAQGAQRCFYPERGMVLFSK